MSAKILQTYGPDRTVFDNPVQIERTRYREDSELGVRRLLSERIAVVPTQSSDRRSCDSSDDHVASTDDRRHDRLTPSTTPAAAGNAEAGAETAGETVREAAWKAIVEMVESLHDDDRRSEAKKPGCAKPAGKELGIGVVDRVRVVVGVGRGRGRRHLVDLRRQTRGILGDLPAPVGLRTGLDEGLPRLPAYREGRRIAAACRLSSWGPARRWLCRGVGPGGRLARRLQDIGLSRQSGCVLHHLPAAVRLLARLSPGLLRSPIRRYRRGEVVAYGFRWWHDRNLCTFEWGLASRASQDYRDRRYPAHRFPSSPSLTLYRRIVAERDQELAEVAAVQQADEGLGRPI
jgi:hypothetical protein